MNNHQIVSTVIIFHNEERYIEEAIESVFAQTYSHWELLLVDDGSTDKSSEIARKHAERHPDKVRYLEHAGHQNRGMSASRNLGVKHARGEFIALLDADDVWLPHKLTEQVVIFDARPEAKMVYDETLTWFGWTGNPRDEQRDHPRRLGVPANTLVEPPGLIPLYLKNTAWTPGTCSVMFRREAFDAVGGFEEGFRGMYEDQAFLYKICLEVPVFVAGGYSAKYRQHPGSCCSLSIKNGLWRHGRQSVSEYAFLKWLAAYLSEQGVRDASIGRALEERLWPYRHPVMHRVSSLVREIKDSIIAMSKRTVKRLVPAAVLELVLRRYRGPRPLTN